MVVSIKLKNHKSPRVDGITNEQLKFGEAALISHSQLERLFERVWEEEVIPEDWFKGGDHCYWEEGGHFILWQQQGYYSESYGVKASGTDDTAQEDECRNGVSSQGKSVWVQTEPLLY